MVNLVLKKFFVTLNCYIEFYIETLGLMIFKYGIMLLSLEKEIKDRVSSFSSLWTVILSLYLDL